MLRFVSILLLLVLAVGGTAFALQNTTPVALDLFLFQIEWPVGAITLATFVLGSLFGLIAGSGVWFRVKRSEVSAKRKLAQSEKELDGLRSNLS